MIELHPSLRAAKIAIATNGVALESWLKPQDGNVGFIEMVILTGSFEGWSHFQKMKNTPAAYIPPNNRTKDDPRLLTKRGV